MIFHDMIFFRDLLNDDDDYDWSNKLVKLRKDFLKSLRTDKRRMAYGCNMYHSNDENVFRRMNVKMRMVSLLYLGIGCVLIRLCLTMMGLEL
jgi:hypothetical protein